MTTAAQVYAGIYLRSLRTGAYDGSPGTTLAKEAAAVAEGFVRLRQWASQLEADMVTPGAELLPEWEETVGLPARGTDEQRAAAVLARLRYFATPTVAELRGALQVILGYEPVIHEVPQADLAASGLNENVYLFAVQLTSWPDDRTLARLQALLDSLKPAHTDYHLCVSYGFLTDDPDSLTDRDVLAE